MAWLLLAPPALWLAILLLFFGQLRAAWREPVLRHPVLIIESDDWGPGPDHHARALRRVHETLRSFHDITGRHPVMTLGLTLSLPDGAAIAASGFSAYQARPFTDPAYADILHAVRDGIHDGVFAPQLHGMSHFWPDTLLHAARTNAAVRQWLADGSGMETENLPSPLQSRWIDARTLPSAALMELDIQTAISEEVDFYRALFGGTPDVAVPPTFIWNHHVERAWAAAGIRCLVTPGRRYESRDAAGHPTGPTTRIHNGESGMGGLIYLVRDDYFEPAYGHRTERGLGALACKAAQGRPCLLETHRFNFTGGQAEAALTELGTLLSHSLSRFPDLRFVSCAELAAHYRNQGNWIEPRISHRYRAWLARIRELPQFWKLARLSGLASILTAMAGRPA